MIAFSESKRTFSKNEYGVWRPEPLKYHPVRKALHFDPQPVAGNIPYYADIQRNPMCEDTLSCREFWDEQFEYCINGYVTAGHFIPGRLYYFLNFRQITGVKGKQYPWFTDMQTEYEYLIGWVKANKWTGIIGPKARRKGFSEYGVNVLEHGVRFVDGYRGGICAGLSNYVEGFKTKMDIAEQEIRPELKMNTLTNNKSEIDYGYRIRNIMGNIEDDGCRSKILMATMYDDPKKFEGEYFNDVVLEESGEFPLLESSYESIRPGLMMGSEVGGTFYIYGCVCAGTKVWTNNGDLINIEHLRQKDGILGFDGKRISQEEITYLQPPREKICYRIETFSGRVLECSEDHPILWSRKDYMRGPHTKEGKVKSTKFVEARDLKVDDQVAVVEEVLIFGEKRIWNPRVTGWLIGDGSYGFNKTPVLSSCDIEITEHIRKNFNTIIEKTYQTKNDKCYQEIRIKNICSHLREMGIYGQTRNEKKLPWFIHSCVKEDICELLGGLFDTDGHVNEFGKNLETITLTSSSHLLLQEVKLLLQRIGIHCNISRIKGMIRIDRKDKNDCYRLNISSRLDILKFQKEVCFSIKYKQEKLNTISQQVKKRTRRLKKGVTGLRFERIISVENIGLKPVYNLTAGTTNTYIANGIVTHNTGGNILSSSRGFKLLYDQSDSLKLARFEVTGQRMLYPFIGLTEKVKDRMIRKGGEPLKQEMPTFKDWKQHEMIGCEDVWRSEEWIIEEDERYQQMGQKKKLREHRQNFPRNVDDIFTSAGKNNFDSDTLYFSLNLAMQEEPMYEQCVLEFEKNITDQGEFLKFPLTVIRRPWTERDPDWKMILIMKGQKPSAILNMDTGGTDAYEADESISSASKLGVIVLRDFRYNPAICPFPERNAILPVCAYYDRPPKRKLSFEISFLIAVYWNLKRNMMVSAEHESCMEYYKNNQGKSLLSLRPKSMDSAQTQQIHKYGVKMTPFSKPRTIAIAQDYVSEWGHLFRLEPLIRDYLAYDEENIGTDWDLADACNNALVRIRDRKGIPIAHGDEPQNLAIENNNRITYYYNDKGVLCAKIPPQKNREPAKYKKPEEEKDYINC